eukprot:6648908-Pyramimonas_sp.AAC.1
MTRTIRAVSRTEFGQQTVPWIPQADAPDVSESITVATSTVAPLTARVKCRKPRAPQDDSNNTN